MHRAALDGVSLAYEERGDGEPVVLVHPGLVADAFLPLMAQPALDKYRLIRYHRRGYGNSSRMDSAVTIADQANDLAQLFESLKVGRGHVAAHSYGGLVALQFASDYPNLVRSLVIMEPALRVRMGGPASQEMTRRMGQSVQCFRDGDPEGAADGFLTVVFGPGYRQALDHALPGTWTQTVRDAETLFAFEIPALQGWQFGAVEAGRITAPVLSVVGGESDPAIKEMQQLLHEWFPQLDRAHVPGVNHLLQLQQPRPVAETLAGFFAQHRLP